MRDEGLIERVIRVVRNHEGKIAKKICENRSDADISKLLFKTKAGSLTTVGFKLMSSLYLFWEMPLSNELNTKQHMLVMRNSSLPYYVTRSRLVMFDPDVGPLLCMADGDPNLLENLFPTSE